MTEKQKVYTAFCFFCAYAFDMKRNYTIKIDLRRPTIGKIPGIVNGDTANTFTFLLTDNGKPVALDPDLNKLIAVFNRSDGKVYTQDADTGLSIDDASAGKIVLDVYASSFTAGKNTVELQVYSRENTTEDVYPDLLTSAYVEFTARKATLTDEGENVPSQLPMLERLIVDTRDAIGDCEDATEELNGLLENIDDEPTEGSDNIVKSGGVYDAIERINKVYIVPYTGSTWIDNVCEITPAESYETLSAISENAVLVIKTPNDSATLYEVENDGREIDFRSPDYDFYNIKYHYEAVIDEYHGAFIRRVYDNSPFQLTVREIVWDNNNELSSVVFNQTASVILDAIGRRPIECDIPCEHDAGGGLVVTDHYYVREISWVATNAYVKEVVLLSYDPFTGDFCKIVLSVNSSSVSAEGSFGTLNA